MNREALNNDIDEYVKNVNADVLRQWAAHVINEDEHLFQSLKLFNNDVLSEEDAALYKEEIKDIFKQRVDRGFVAYHQANKLFFELDHFLDNDVEMLMRKGQQETAFDLTKQVFLRLSKLSIDDSGGGLTFTLNKIISIWQDLIEQYDEKLYKKMFQWLIGERSPSAMGVTEEYTEEFLFKNFKDNKSLEKKLNIVEKKLDVLGPEQEDDLFFSAHEVGKWSLRYIRLSRDLKKDEDIIEKFIIDHLYTNEVREYYVSECIDKGDYNKAIELLEAGKVSERNRPGLVIKYSKQLKDLYKLQDNHQAYIDELWELALEHEPGNVSVFKELKALYTAEEWLKKREIIFDKTNAFSGKDQLYIVENLYDRLLKLVVESNGLWMLREHRNILLEKYPDEVLDKYELEMEGAAGRASDRSGYRKVVGTLREIQKVSGGKNLVDKLVQKWNVKYKHRPAMLDELSKL